MNASFHMITNIVVIRTKVIYYLNQFLQIKNDEEISFKYVKREVFAVLPVSVLITIDYVTVYY